MLGKLSSAPWQTTTAGEKTRLRQFELRRTLPLVSVNTRSPRFLPTMSEASSAVRSAGKGTERLAKKG